MEIADRVKELIKDLLAAMQSARLYSTNHKKFGQAVDKAYKDIEEILFDRRELIIGIIEDDFAFESEIFFDFATMPFAQEVMASLRGSGIEKIIFNNYMRRDELETFLNFLVYILGKGVILNGKEQLAILGVENISVELITSPISPYEAQKRSEKIDFGVYEDYLNKAAEYLEALLNNQAVDYIALKLNIFSLKDNLLNLQKISRLIDVKATGSANVVIHSANVSILAMNFSSKLGFARDEVLETAIAALFHDIGRMLFSRKVKEPADSNSHSEKGAAILLKYKNILGELPAVAAFEHHMRHEVRAYPKFLSSYRPSIVSELIYICDVYDSLSRRGGVNYRYSPDIIYKLMSQEKGSAFNPELLEIFFRITGIWPVGTIALLSDGRVGLVCEENESDISRPKVEIKEHPINKVVDLKESGELKIEKALNPFTEGKDYLNSLDTFGGV